MSGNIADLYGQYLGRAPDAEGLNYWQSALDSGAASWADIQWGISNSQEAQNFQNKFETPTAAPSSGGGSSTPSIDWSGIYNQYLGRDYDQAGVNHYNERLSQGASMEDVLFSIRNSQEAQQYGMNYRPPSGGGGSVSPASGGGGTPAPQPSGGGVDWNSIYQQYLGRDADAGGVAHYTEKLASGASMNDIMYNIQNSQEAKNYNIDKNPLTAGGVDWNKIYQATLGREADASGAQYWAGQYKNGVGLDSIIKAMSASEEGNKYWQNKFQQTGQVHNPLAEAGLNLQGMKWDDVVNMMKTSNQVAFDDNWQRRGEGNLDAQINQNINFNGRGAQLFVPTAPTTTWNGEADPNFNRWDNAHMSFTDPTDDDYFFKVSRGEDGTAKYTRHKDVADIGFAVDMVKFISTAVGMNGLTQMAAKGLGNLGINAATEGAASAGMNGLADMSVDELIRQAVSEASADVGGYLLPGYEAITEQVLENVGNWADKWTPDMNNPLDGGNGPSQLETPITPEDMSGPGLPLDENQLANEATKLINQNNAPPGTLPQVNPAPGVPTIDTTGPGLPGGPGSTPNIPKVPTLPGGGGGGGGTTKPGGMDIGKLLSLLYGAYSKKNTGDQFKGLLDQMMNMYKPGSPEALQMQRELAARDAKAGRRSQYGPRSTELNAKLADARMKMMSSPGFLAMQAAQMNNSPSTGGLSELVASLGGKSGLNSLLGGADLNQILNTGLIDGEGWAKDGIDWIKNLF